MPKKRNCRRSPEERIIHDKAVALRKMTDEQIVDAFESQYQDGYTAGLEARVSNQSSANDHLFSILDGLKGIRSSTIEKIKVALESQL